MFRFSVVLLRSVLVTFIGLLIGGGTLTLAADRAAQRPTLVAVSRGPNMLTVPQVTGQAYVFAKGILQDSGFAWTVLGPVRGFAGNVVVTQKPTAGSVVLDTGAPTVTLTLRRIKSYSELGSPDNVAPYEGTDVSFPAGVAQPASGGATPTEEPTSR